MQGLSLKIKTRDFITTLAFFTCLLSFQYRKFFSQSNLLNVFFTYLPFIVSILYLVYVLSHNNNRDGKRNGKIILGIYLPYLLFIIGIEIFASAFNSTVIGNYGIRYWTRVVSTLLGRLGPIIMVYCCIANNKKGCCKCIVNAFIIDGLVIILNSILKCGLIETFQGFLNPVISNIGETGSSYLEVHEATFAIGMLLLYLLFFDKNRDISKRKIFVLFFLFFIGGKRIGYFAFLVAMLCYFLFRKAISRKTLIIFAIAGFVIPYLYLSLVFNNDLMNIMQLYGINVMGRDSLYLYFTNRASFSLDYIGAGFASTSKMLENMSRTEVGSMFVVRGIHNDFLKLYFEYGFIGFGVWLYYSLFYISSVFYRRFGNNTLKLYIICLVFAFITYLTDNTETYPVFQAMLLLLPLLCKTDRIES